MDRAAFAQLVRDVIAAMGQRLDAARPIAEGLALRTSDGYLYVFVEDPSLGSVQAVNRWRHEGDVSPDRLVVFSRDALPASWGSEIEGNGGRVVAGNDFRRLVDALGIDSPLVEKDPNIHRPLRAALPSARELEANMLRAQTWVDAGVLPLAARFFQAAVDLKPEFIPGWIGLAKSRAALGEWDAAALAWAAVLSREPGSLEAEIGLASIAGARGNVEEEIRQCRAIVREHPRSSAARAALVAVLLDRGEWADARGELEALLLSVPEDPRLHFLRAVTLDRSGDADAAARERENARRLGLTEAEEHALLRSMRARPPGAVS